MTLKEFIQEKDEKNLDPTDWQQKYILKNPDWKNDIIPEIIEGTNIIDYVDPEIEQKI